jgi:hypothetical protein
MDIGSSVGAGGVAVSKGIGPGFVALSMTGPGSRGMPGGPVMLKSGYGGTSPLSGVPFSSICRFFSLLSLIPSPNVGPNGSLATSGSPYPVFPPTLATPSPFKLNKTRLPAAWQTCTSWPSAEQSSKPGACRACRAFGAVQPGNE